MQQTTCPITNKMRQYELNSKQCCIHIILVLLYVEPGSNFNVLVFESFLALSVWF